MNRPEGCFFGEKVTKDVSKKIDVKEGLLLHISHASLDHTSKGPVSLVVNTGSNDFVICTLKDFGHASLDLNFSSSVILKVKGEGKNAVHVSGYWEFMADPEMDMLEEDEEEEEEEVPVPTKKSPKAEAAPVSKKSPKAEPVSKKIVEMAEDDEESMTPSMLEALEEFEEFEEFEEDFEEDDEDEEPVVQAPPAKKRQAAVAAAPPAKKAKTEPKKAAPAPAAKKQEKKQTPPPAAAQGGKKGKKGGKK
eukprot:TRINITY_DN1222_c1_g4_i1.p1 TRINITY_DN1222_c1_g4~~TRINITY_DN1222_c1_g4_i1.p1  ORF type:complete len:265 (+),score=118.78 TRINITY_DN1222_c1_g4_i1:51-797(+)